MYGGAKQNAPQNNNELVWFCFFIPEIRTGNRHLRCDYIGAGMAGPPNQEKQNHNRLGPDIQLVAGLDGHWMAGGTVFGGQKINDNRDKNPGPRQEIKFYGIIGSDWGSAVYKRYIRNANRDKNPARHPEIKFYEIIGSKRQTAVYKCYIRFDFCDKNP